MTRLAALLMASAMLSLGCVKRTVLPDPTVPHQVAEETTVRVWCRAGDGKLEKCKVRLLEGWWVASPQVVEK